MTARRAGSACTPTRMSSWPARVACSASAHTALMSAGAYSNRIGRAKSSTSLTTRLRRATSSSTSVRACVMSARLTRSLASVRSDALMIINGFRISCAMTVDRRPSADSRSRCAASRWKRAIESVSVLKVAASSLASSSSQLAARLSAIFRVRSPVADISRITSVMVASGLVIVRATA